MATGYFKKIKTPDNKEFFIPSDINLIFPEDNNPPEVRRGTATIPWQEKDINLCPKEFMPFLKYVLSFLRARSVDIHVATCLSLMDEYIGRFKVETGFTLNRRVVAIGLILHDCGWSALSQKEIAASLAGYSGLKLSKTSLGPKEKHAREGVKIARKILKDYRFEPELAEEEKKVILDAVLLHDRTDLLGELPNEIKAVMDLDHFWSFTHLNFWQDTIRKNLSPQKYLEGLGRDLDPYFSTESGRDIARRLLEERKEEADLL